MPLQWRNRIWQSLEDGAGKRCSECGTDCEGAGNKTFTLSPTSAAPVPPTPTDLHQDEQPLLDKLNAVLHGG